MMIVKKLLSQWERAPYFSLRLKFWNYAFQRVSHVCVAGFDVYLPVQLRRGSRVRLSYRDADIRLEIDAKVLDCIEKSGALRWCARIALIGDPDNKHILYFMALRNHMDSFDGSRGMD